MSLLVSFIRIKRMGWDGQYSEQGNQKKSLHFNLPCWVVRLRAC